MQPSLIRMCCCVFALVLIAGCQEKLAVQGTKPTAADVAAAAEAEIKAKLAKLGPEDQRLAEQQRYCAVMPEVRLGQMGTPYKVEINGETVFVCCKGCVRSAQEDPETTLAQLKEIKDRAAAAGK
jgi:hypothetical protein